MTLVLLNFLKKLNRYTEVRHFYDDKNSYPQELVNELKIPGEEFCVIIFLEHGSLQDVIIDTFLMNIMIKSHRKFPV